jgi:hypothetical protein
MSRNKQIDRLRIGLDEHIKSRGKAGLVDIDKIENVVDFALSIIRGRQGEVDRLQTVLDDDYKLFYQLRSEFTGLCYNGSTIISRPFPALDISLEELGWNDNALHTTEERALFISIIWLIIKDLQNKIKWFKNDRNILYGHLRTRMIDAGMVNDSCPSTIKKDTDFGELIDLAVSVYIDTEELRKRSEKNKEEANKTVLSQEGTIEKQSVIISELTDELRYQTATSKLYKRESDLLRKDIIDREVSGERL